MKIMLSALENARQSKKEGGVDVADIMIQNGIKFKWNLMSYYYIKGKFEGLATRIRDNSELVMIDSGAHSFQFGKKVEWKSYTEEYSEFIRRFDRPNVIGYFEMDIENIIGYEKVKELRKIIEKATDKVIPVWHPDRGIEDYEKMCKEYSGRIIAIGGFKNTDIKDDQYLMFIKVARKYNCKVHCLGMTRTNILDKVPFDFTDSASWNQASYFGKIGNGKFSVGKVTRQFSSEHKGECLIQNYKIGMKMQEHYYRRWKKECKD